MKAIFLSGMRQITTLEPEAPATRFSTSLRLESGTKASNRQRG